MRLKIWCDGECEKFCKIFWEVNKAKEETINKKKMKGFRKRPCTSGIASTVLLLQLQMGLHFCFSFEEQMGFYLLWYWYHTRGALWASLLGFALARCGSKSSRPGGWLVGGRSEFYTFWGLPALVGTVQCMHGGHSACRQRQAMAKSALCACATGCGGDRDRPFRFAVVQTSE
jgi:hypothetical protein